ncbi:MAG: 4Fe-4S binding protein [Candidatus Thermoplasmatota archaeon]|nr:4Fe-4S binding protein [Planctomycetota bacterium]MEC8998267.1 4Fe-4S binding protein [Candidatus Thermoplasmatota archaeon]
MSYHPHGTPSFRNLVVRPMWITMKTALRTVPFLGKLKILKNDYHGQPAYMVDPETRRRVGEEHPSAYQKFSADRETSAIMPFVERPVTVMYPYERLEDLEPWLFVPGNYNGRIGIVWETCTACKLCIRICPNDCLHMTSELRVNVLDTVDDDHEWHGYGSEVEVGGYAAKPKEDFDEIADGFDLVNNHGIAPQQYDFAEVIDITGDIATVRWSDGSGVADVDLDSLKPAEQDIVSGRIDLGRCMFCGLCMEACPFESFFMTNEYDGMSGFSREELWMDADRTRVLPAVHQERVDMELAKRAQKEKERRAKKAARAGV